MQMPSSEDRRKALSWLNHGVELARSLKGEQIKVRDVIWCLLTDAIDMIDRTPDQERRWLTSGSRSGGWGMVGMSAAELQQIERIRILSAMTPCDSGNRYSPQQNDLERALGVMSWLRWCNSARQPERLTKAAVVLARNGDHEAVHRIYCPTRKPNRQNINEIKTRTVGYILNGLKNVMGIVASDDLKFEELRS